MPAKKTARRARKSTAKSRKAPSTRAGKYVGKEIRHVRSGKQGAKSAKQAIAIGLSKARRAGVKVKPPKGSSATRGKASRASTAKRRKKPAARRSTATKKRAA